MVLNDFNRDVRVLLAEEGITKSGVAERMGVSPQYITQILKHKPMTGSFVKFIDAAGYDIEVKYIPKEEKM